MSDHFMIEENTHNDFKCVFRMKSQAYEISRWRGDKIQPREKKEGT
jgi:hypothetical protein